MHKSPPADVTINKATHILAFLFAYARGGGGDKTLTNTKSTRAPALHFRSSPLGHRQPTFFASIPCSSPSLMSSYLSKTCACGCVCTCTCTRRVAAVTPVSTSTNTAADQQEKQAFGVRNKSLDGARPVVPTNKARLSSPASPSRCSHPEQSTTLVHYRTDGPLSTTRSSDRTAPTLIAQSIDQRFLADNGRLRPPSTYPYHR